MSSTRSGFPGTWWARNTRAPSQADYGRRGQRAFEAVADRRVEGFADEVLVGQRDQYRPAGRDQFVEPVGDRQRPLGVLAEVVSMPEDWG